MACVLYITNALHHSHYHHPSCTYKYFVFCIHLLGCVSVSREDLVRAFPLLSAPPATMLALAFPFSTATTLTQRICSVLKKSSASRTSPAHPDPWDQYIDQLERNPIFVIEFRQAATLKRKQKSPKH
ncbi:uncharacterized protein VTP21DRAFT_7911 [Calcarisporiella thermophila]|uniref:uncharacterized protein n=1 Tax=Calcarisporiella thermophila TaxID=911321 RepID=UPI0037434BD3